MISGGADATGRAGKDGPNAHLAGVVYGRDPAVGLHDEHLTKPLVRREPVLKVLKVPAEDRANVGVDDGGAKPVELFDLGNDFVG